VPAARQRAAKEREARIEAALARLPELAKIKQRQGKKPEAARASSTDAHASVMKMGDGGFRPAYNVQYGTDTESQIIVGVEVVTSGSDQGQLAAMVEQVTARCGQTPSEWLVDGGYPAHEQIEAVADKTELYAPVPEPRGKGKAGKDGDDVPPPDKHQPKEGDSVPVAQWRSRMAGQHIKEIYKQRAATAECVNALARNRGLQRLPVRGLSKVRAVAVLYALAHNLLRMVKIAPQLIGLGTGASAMAQAAA